MIGSFQSKLGGGSTDWDAASALPMTRQAHPHGFLFTAVLPSAFPDGFYEYKYQVTFENGQQRAAGDPCTKYGGESNESWAFLIGGQVPSSIPSLRPRENLAALQGLADQLRLEVRIAHYPPYCSKHNPIEHRLFPHVTRACQGVVFHSVDIVKRVYGKGLH